VRLLRDAVDDLTDNKRRSTVEGPLSDQGHATVRVTNILEKTTAVDGLVFSPVVVSVLTCLLGEHFRLLGSEAFTRGHDEQFLLGFHTDGGPLLQRVLVAPEGHALQVKVQFFLTDVDHPDRGQLLVVPGSHRRLPAVAEANCYVDEANRHVRDGHTPPGTVVVPARAGDISIHNHSTWHAVGPNTSGHIRRSVILRYGQPWCAPHDYVAYQAAVLDRFSTEDRRRLGDLPVADPAAAYKPSRWWA
jgi:ectoine hydroxylase-related dioxygenase (phytanoyl-CoA dioxygenase family)